MTSTRVVSCDCPGTTAWRAVGWAAGFAGVAAGLVLLVGRTFTAATVLGNVMPLGDSLTFGSYRGSTHVPGGYRTALHADLAPNFAFQFVGSGTTNPGAALTAAGQTAHEGHPGSTIEGIATGVSDWLSDSRPDYVLLMIGTNDIYNKTYWGGAAVGTGGSDTSAVQAKLRTLISTIVSARPTAHVLVSNLLPISTNANSTANDYVKNYNAAIRDSIVPDFVAAGKLVSLVDNYGSFVDASGNTTAIWARSDPDWHIHPDQTGYDIIGGNFAAAIREVAGPEPATPTLALAAGIAAGVAAWWTRRSRSRHGPA